MGSADVGTISYRARWVLPGEGPPISGGVATVGEGKVLAVGRNTFDVDLGEVVLAPGFANVHCHLDLSNSKRPEVMPASFADWLRGVVEQRRSQAPLEPEAIAAIAEDMKRQGAAALGDVALGEAAAKTRAASAMAGVTFCEVLGLLEERYRPLVDEAMTRVGQTVGRRTIGVSPHAPYSTAAEVYRWASGFRCTHWLESPDEVEFLRTGGGPMKAFLEAIGAWPDSAPSGPWYGDPWEELLGDPSEWLLVHANFTTPADLEHALRLSHGKPLKIAYCPRTHAAFGFNEYPLAMFLNAGCLVGLGTDSLASNPDLDVFKEAVYVAERFPQFADERLLRMLTLDGARLLGCEGDNGTVEAGKAAAIVILRSPGQGERFDWPRFFSHETTVLGRLDDGSAAFAGTS